MTDPISRLNAALEGRYRVGDDVDGIHQDHRLLSTHAMTTAVAATRSRDWTHQRHATFGRCDDDVILPHRRCLERL